jgi:transposase-like protein
LEVQAGVSVTEVAERFGVSRQAVHRWIGWYAEEGLDGLADRSSRPHSSPGQTSPEVEARICEMRRAHPRWGARRIEFELGRNGCPGPIPSRVTVHRVLLRPAGHCPHRRWPAPTRRQRHPATQPAQPAHPRRTGPAARRPPRRPTTPTRHRTDPRPATSRQPRRPGHRWPEDPRRQPPRRTNPRRRGGRHHLAHLRRQPARLRGPPHHHEGDRPVQGPQTRTATAQRHRRLNGVCSRTAPAVSRQSKIPPRAGNPMA